MRRPSETVKPGAGRSHPPDKRRRVGLDLSDVELAAIVTVIAVWLGFRYQLRGLEREHRRAAALIALSHVQEMSMIVDALQRYVALTEEGEPTAGAPSGGAIGFFARSLNRTGKEFQRRFWFLVVPSVFGE